LLHKDMTFFCTSYKCVSDNHYSPTLRNIRVTPFVSQISSTFMAIINNRFYI